MSEYLERIIEQFDPVDYIMADEEELNQLLPDNPSVEEVMEAHRTLTRGQERGGAILTGKILGEMYHLSIEVRNHIDRVETAGISQWSGEQKDDIHLFFAFIGQLQEHLLREAVVRHIISSEATTDSMREFIISDENGRGMSARKCLDYLHHGGIIDSGLKGEIGQVRNERNEAVHDITRWFWKEYDPQHLRSQVARGERSVIKLLDLVYGFGLENYTD